MVSAVCSAGRKSERVRVRLTLSKGSVRRLMSVSSVQLAGHQASLRVGKVEVSAEVSGGSS